jgi:hypothetical protein
MVTKIATKHKFIVGHRLAKKDHWIILTDFMYWGQPEIMTELTSWCENCLSNGKDAIQGSVMQFVNEQELTLFILRWS